MPLFRVVGVGLLGVALATMLKRERPEMHLIVLLATGVMILVLVLSPMTGVINSFATLLAKAGVDDALFGGVLKIVGVGYVTEYAASMCTDAGASSVADKIHLAGKISVFLMGLPIITALVQTLAALLQ